MTSFGQHAREVADSVRSGPLGEMRAATRLTPKDLRRGAERAEEDAACRRRAADRMERDGIESIVPGQVVVLGEKHELTPSDEVQSQQENDR